MTVQTLLPRDNRDVFQTSDEGRSWRDRALAPLIREEQVLLPRYLTERDQPVLDCGCGAGRIAYNLVQQGFTDVCGFDYSDEMLKAAEAARPPGVKVQFHLADATDLHVYPDNAFQYALYLQQIISLIPRESFPDLLQHAIRITRPEGLLLFAALNMDGRTINRIVSPLVSVTRAVRREPRQSQAMPWLTLGERFNWRFLSAGQPTNYWFRREELVNSLTDAGLEIVEVTTSRELRSRQDGPEGNLYVVCRKPA